MKAAKEKTPQAAVAEGEAPTSRVPVPPSDRFFLLFEGKGAPVSCLWVVTLHGRAIRPERLRAAVEAALARHPRARARLGIEGQGRSRRLYWEPAQVPVEEICRFHPPEETPRSEEALAALIARIQNQPFDLEHGPLVELHVYGGEPEDHGMLALRFHHALADGIGSLVFLRDLFRSPESGGDGVGLKTAGGEHEKVAPRKLLWRLAVHLMRAGLRTRFAIPDHVYRSRKAPRGEFACAIRRLAVEREPSIAEAARRLGVGRNDLFVACCARAIAELKEERGERCGTLRIMINRRFRRKATTFANHSSAFPVWIRPRDRRDPVALARRIRRQVREAVRRRVDQAIHRLGRLLALPPPIPRLLVSSAKRRIGSDSFIVSNLGRLPDLGFGPGEARAVRASAFVRPPNGVGMVLAVTATGESTTLALSYLADALTAREAHRLLELIEGELEGFDTARGGVPSS